MKAFMPSLLVKLKIEVKKLLGILDFKLLRGRSQGSEFLPSEVDVDEMISRCLPH